VLHFAFGSRKSIIAGTRQTDRDYKPWILGEILSSECECGSSRAIPKSHFDQNDTPIDRHVDEGR
jgi:hypothetical protein